MKRSALPSTIACSLFVALTTVVACVGDTSTPGPDGGGARTACSRATDCPANQACSLYDVQNQQVFCQPAQATGADIGQACKSNDACKSSLCAPNLSTCTARCTTDTDCGFAHCAQVKTGSWVVGACFASCKRDSDCPNGLACFLLRNPDGSAWTTACNPQHAAGAPAGAEKGADGCYTDLSTDSGGKTYCGKLCGGATDCAGVGPFTKCSKSTITNPNGSGSTTIDACVP